MSTISISKKEYQNLMETKLRYEYLRQMFEENIFSPPPTKKSAAVLSAFKATGKYNKKFLKGLRDGLRRSSHYRKK